MWLLRYVTRSHWDARDVELAFPDLRLDYENGETGLSVYWAENEDECITVAALYSAHFRAPGKPFDYVSITPELLIALGLVASPVPEPNQHPTLSARHFEITQAGKHPITEADSRALAGRILQDQAPTRVAPLKIKERVKQLAETHPDLLAFAGNQREAWERALGLQAP